MPHEFLIIKCPKGCPETFWTMTEMANHHLEAHGCVLPPRHAALEAVATGDEDLDDTFVAFEEQMRENFTRLKEDWRVPVIEDAPDEAPRLGTEAALRQVAQKLVDEARPPAPAPDAPPTGPATSS
jgi:hypothetical protein